jgi:hypothetical protein
VKLGGELWVICGAEVLMGGGEGWFNGWGLVGHDPTVHPHYEVELCSFELFCSLTSKVRIWLSMSYLKSCQGHVCLQLLNSLNMGNLNLC